jgi:siroheme decarboxylase
MSFPRRRESRKIKAFWTPACAGVTALVTFYESLKVGWGMLDELDKEIIRLIQGDLPMDLRPFHIPAQKLGISEEEFVERVKSLKDREIIRRFGATLRHQEAGFSANAMVAWIVPEERIEEVGAAMSAFREVTHCYQRQSYDDWKYNLYTMVHGENDEQCYRMAEKMSAETGMTEYVLLFSEKEFKKTSMEYF